MTSNGDVHAFSDKHSVKEVVVSFFVVPSIDSVEAYGKLICAGGSLHDDYHKFELIKQVDFQIKQGNENPEVRELHNAGFKLIGFKNGRASKIIQGINEPGRSLFTFNSVDYTNWKCFYNDMLCSARKVSSFSPFFTVIAISLLYIDEFYFDDKTAYNASNLFNENSKFLPRDIMDCSTVDFNLNVARNKNGYNYIENLSIKVLDEAVKKRIQIIDNISFVLIKPTPLQVLLNKDQSDLCSLLNFAHTENKNELIDILNDNICKKIKIKK